MKNQITIYDYLKPHYKIIFNKTLGYLSTIIFSKIKTDTIVFNSDLMIINFFKNQNFYYNNIILITW